MAHSVKVGDRVLFHFIPAHVCGGRDCNCADTETVARPGVVTRLHDACQQVGCEGAECLDCAELAQLEPIDLLVEMTEAELEQGYAREQGPQNRSRATGETPHESGTWTIPTFTAAPVGDGVASKR